jgi:ABC-2 type transport system permease protein
MRKILAVIRREYLSSIQTKMFWIGTLAFPLAMTVMIGLSAAAQLMNPEQQKTLAVIDLTGQLGDRIAERLGEHELKDSRAEFVIERVDPVSDLDAERESLEPRVLSGSLYGILTLGADIDADDNFGLYRKSVGDEGAARTIRRAITDSVVALRLERSELEIDQERLEALVRDVSLVSFQVTEEQTKEKDFAEELIPTFGFVLILFFTLYFHGFSIARSIIQEKSNRVIEVLLGSLSSDQLMTGKILGVGLVGLTQVGIYTLVALGLRVAFSATQGALLRDALSNSNLLYFLVFFLLGYFLFATLFAIIGAVCTTEQDAQNLQFPVMMCLMIPYLLTFFFVKHPDSTASVVSSFIPLFTPMVMFMRISVLTPPFWQIALSIVLTLGTIYVMFRAAAKVFRIGTLMYGKRPGIGEILRWARS